MANMAKTNKLSKIFVVLLFVVVAATLTFAFVNVPNGAANAEDITLDNNTAAYELDTENAIMSPWRFSWNGGNSYWYNQGQQGSDEVPGNPQLKFKITTAGKFVFRWESSDSDRAATNGDLILTVTRQKQGGEPETLRDKVQLHDPDDGMGYPSNGYYNNYGRFESIDSVEEGDIVTLSFETRRSSVKIRIQNPQNTSNINISVAEDSVGLGQVKSGETTDNNLILHPQWGTQVTFEAVPSDGAVFAYWTDDTDSIVSNGIVYTSDNVFGIDGKNYYAHFVSSDYSSIQSSKKDDKPFWSATDGKWSFDFSNYSPADKDVASLTYEFVAQEGQYVSFDYFQSCNAFAAISQKLSTPIFKLYLNGTELKKFVPYNAAHEETDAIGNFAVPVTKAGYNQIEFRFNVVYSARDLWQYEEGDQVYVKNIKVCNEEEVQTTQFVFTFESEWLKVTCTDVAKKETKEISSGEPVDLLNGTMWQISSSTKSSKKPSEFDSSVQVNYSRTGVWTSEVGDISSYFVPQGKAIATRSTDFSSSNSSVKTFRLDRKTEIETGYTEEVPLAVSATKTTDNEDTIIDIPNGTIIDFPFGKENTMVVRIDTYSQFDAENYEITLDGQVYSGRIEAMDEFLAFVLTDVKNHIVSIKYNLPDDGKYIYSKARIEFMVKEGVEGGIEHIVKTPDSLNVEDIKSWGGQDTWLFDPELSVEGNYVYQASNSFDWIDESVSTGQGGLSTFTLSMKDTVAEETGSISFEFQISGGYYAQQNQQLFGAYLCYRVGEAVTTSDFYNMMEGQEQPEYLKDLAKSSTGGEILTGNGVAKAGDWYRANIIIQKGETIYISFFSYNVKAHLNEPIDTYLNIRNIRLNVGNTNVTVQRGADAKGTVTSAIGEQRNENKTESVSYDVAIGSTLELSATPSDGEEFYGWSVNGALVSTEPTISLFVEGQMNVVAWMAPANFYTARAEGQFFKTIEEAVDGAENGTVYVIQDTTIRESFTIPTGVTLLIPYNEANGFMEAGKEGTAENKISWLNPKYQDAYRTVTVAEGCKITVEGTLRVGAVVNYLKGQGYQGHTSGAYAELILKTGSSIQVASGGVMDVYGRVWGGEDAKKSGMGTIDVAEGGKLYEPFLILDYTGGTNAFGAFMDGTTPFKRYAMINIECPMTIHYGGMLYGHASLWVETMTLHASLDQPFISYDMGNEKGGDGQGADTFVMLHKDSSVKITYNPDKIVDNASVTNCTEGIGQTTMIFEGGATFSYMKFSAMGISIPTSVVVFSIPYNFNVELNGNEAQYETVTDFMLMPGATVTVGEGATLTLSANTWIFDGFVQPELAGKGYPTATDLKNAGYSQSGNLIVNGNLKISKKKPIKVTVTIAEGPDEDEPIPAIFVGIVQTTSNTGKIDIDPQAILSYRPFDGVEGSSASNYFSYQSTARVWDAAHGCFADLEAGKTYTAVKGKEGNDVTFTLDSIKYTNTKQSETDELTLTLNQQMHGSWMEVHKGHQLDWTPNPEELGSLDSANFCELTRKCSVMGCDHSTSMYLLKDLNVLTAQTFKGEAYTDEQLQEIFLKMIFGEQADTAKGKITIVIGQHDELKNVPVSPYQIEITLTGAGWWLAGSSKYEYAKTFNFNIQKYDISEKTGLTVTDIGAKTYTGQQITVSDVDIQFANQKLAKGTDYTLGFGNNTNVADGGTVTVTGTGNFTGTFTLKFDIKPADISGGTLTVQDPNFVYNGQAQTPTRDHLIILNVAGFDNSVITVDIQATDNTNAGTAHVTVKGTGNFTGKLSATFDIKKATATVTLTAAEGTYGDTPKDIAFEVTDYKVDADKAVIEKAVQITHTATSNSGVGNYAVNVKVGELQNYEVNVKNGNRSQDGWTVQKVYTVNAKSIEGATVTIKEGKTYTFKGENITPEVGDVQVTLDGWDKPITFTVKASDNLNKGTAHFTVTGTENYTGTSKQGDFTIDPAKVDIQVNSLSSAQGDELSTNYGYTFLNNTKFFGNDKATFDQKIADKYSTDAQKDKISDQYKITLDIKDAQAALTNYTITVKEGVYTVTDSIFAGVTFAAGTVTYDGSKHTLTAQGTEKIKGTPKIEYKYQKGDSTVDNAWQDIPDGGFTDAGKYSIRVTITVDDHESKYQETRLLTIEPKNIEGATVTVGGEYTYTGKAITVDKANITVKLDAWSLPIDFDIDAEGYADNINATTDKQATVTITGKGNYTGTATGNFDIARKNISGGTLTVTGTYTYNGNAQTPQGDELSVTLQGFDNVSFKVKEEGGYENNTNATTSASKAKVTVEGTGNFVGELSAQFDIQQAKIDSVEVQNPETYIYNKTPIEPTLVVKSGTLTLDKDDYDIEYTTAEKEHTNAGTVTFTVKAKANSNFTGEVTGKSFVINKKQITVKLLKQTSVYTGVAPTVSSEQGIGWEVDGDAICEGDDLNIELRAEGLTAAAKTYVIDPKYSNPNYEVKWAPETAELEITPATITVTVKPASSTYGDAAAKLEIEVQGICSSDSTLNINDYVTLSCEVNEKTGYGTYDITCTKKSDPENYTINIVNNAKYTVNKKDVTVTINDQNATYNFEGKYDLDQTKWELADGQSLANGETKNALKVKLARVAITSAGEYAITGASDNPNYNVTFEGAWAQEDGNKGKAGVYTVAKKTLVHDGEYVIFMLAIGDDVDVEEKRSVKFVGEDIELSARIYVMEGSELSEITGYELSESTLTASGTYTIVVTINDVNYEGSRTFTVEVLTEEGYSQALSDALKELEEKVGDLTADALTSSEEHFEIIKQVKAILNALSEEDKQAGAEQLAKYEELVETWDAAADISDDVIETAKNIADMPIKWLFAMAEMSVLLAALYVVGKGGLM